MFACLRISFTISLASLSAGILVGGLLYQQALHDVEDRLAGPLWAPSGRVLSGPMELWAGLQMSPEELAADLAAAGYARAASAEKPGDFQVDAQDVLVMVPSVQGPGWKTEGGEVHVAFSKGRIKAISPKKRARLAPMELASLRGAENEDRRPVALKELPKHVPMAILAMEDARFREHPGVDPLGVARAIFTNLSAGATVQGGSTLTQQLVKNLFLNQERSLERKAREALLAVAIERTRTKDQILELYLNEIYLGETAGASICGVDQAARAWFGKPASRLDLGEAATIAGVISAPNRYSPIRHGDRAVERRNLALSRMADLGWITSEQAETEQEKVLVVHPGVGQRRAPWLVDAAVEAVEELQGSGSVSARGLVVQTTLQPALQRLAERAVAEGAAELDAKFPKARGAEISLVAVRVRDGAVVAMVGGRDFGTSQFNRAVHGRRQVGSTAKPFTYLAAFEEDPTLSPVSKVLDEPIERTVAGKSWSPKNYDGNYKGEIPLRQALAESRNIPAVLMAEQVGYGDLARRNKDLGLTGADDNPAASLGSFLGTPLELAGAYTVFPGAGNYAQPRLVETVVDPAGKKLWSEEAIVLPRASPRASFLSHRLLQAVLSEGTGRGAATFGVKGAVGAKSGTTDDARDAWFAGYTDELVVVVWVGFDKGKDLGLTGAEAAMPTWARFVAASGTMPGEFSVPSGLEKVSICRSDWLPVEAGTDCGAVLEEYLPAQALPGLRREKGDESAAPGPIARLIDEVRRGVGGKPEEAPTRRREEPRVRPDGRPAKAKGKRDR
jgi:penicillin-binding protein 1B